MSESRRFFAEGVASGATFGLYDFVRPLIGNNAVEWPKYKQLAAAPFKEVRANFLGTLMGGALAATGIGSIFGWEAGLISVPAGGVSWFVLQIVSGSVHQARQDAIHRRHTNPK